MKSKAELKPIIDQIASAESPVGMDAVYVHALILQKLGEMELRLSRLEEHLRRLGSDAPANPP
jgi:hypothetical protein